MKIIVTSIRSAFILLVLLTVLLGGVYPLVVTVFAQMFFHTGANGSLIVKDDKVIGSELLGQEFVSPKYLWSRLSATTPPYNPSGSSGSNFNPANPKLLEAANQRIKALQQADLANKQLIPIDLVTASGSGLDPHISLAAAQYQLPRVAHARNIKPEVLQALVDKYTESNGFGLLGAPYINVVRLNMALDEK
jgi:K+-transporting ATPase ATPase C chain